MILGVVTNCRGNPPWLPILRAATGGRPYNILFGSGSARLGILAHFRHFMHFLLR
jgi:hypothetical protein